MLALQSFTQQVPGSRIFARVGVRDSRGWGADVVSKSEVVIKTVPGQVMTPFPLTALTSSTVTFGWRSPSDGASTITAYETRERVEGDELGQLDTLTQVKILNFTSTHVKDGAQFNFLVRAQNKYGWGQWSPALRIQRQPPSITGVEAQEAFQRIALAWSFSDPSITDIRVQFKTSTGGY